MSEWFYTKNEQQHGPVAIEQLNQLAATGALDPSDLVWKDGMAAWLPASQIPGLSVRSRPLPPHPTGSGAVGSTSAASALLTRFLIPQTILVMLGIFLLGTILMVMSSGFGAAWSLGNLAELIATPIGIWLAIMALKLKGIAPNGTTSDRMLPWLLLATGSLPVVMVLFCLLTGWSNLDGFAPEILTTVAILPLGGYTWFALREIMARR